MNDKTVQGQVCSNNVVEGWNNRFSSLLNCKHPNFWKVLNGLKKEQSHIDAEIVQADAGVRQSRRKDQVRQETRILNILNVPTTTAFEKVMTLAEIISLKKS